MTKCSSARDKICLGKDEDHVQWTKLLLGALNELINFIKKNHTTGLVWNVKVKYPLKTLNTST